MKPLFFASLLATSLSVPLFANPSCRERITEFMSRDFLAGRHFTVLSPKTKRVVIGSLIEAEDGKLYLGVNGYRWRHSLLNETFLTLEAQGEIAPFRYLWLGELQLTNPADAETVGWLRRATDVSGYWNKRMRFIPGNENQVDVLGDALMTCYPTLLHRNFETATFEELSKRGSIYLLDDLNQFITKFEKQKLKGNIPVSEDYRHYIGNRIASVLLWVKHILEADDEFPTPAAKERALAELIDSVLTVRSLSLFLTILENDGVEHPSLQKVQRVLKHLEERYLSQKEWSNFFHQGELLVRYLTGVHLSWFDPSRISTGVDLAEWQELNAVGGELLGDTESQSSQEQISPVSKAMFEAQVILLNP